MGIFFKSKVQDKKLKTISGLLKEAWQMYRVRFKRLSGIMAIPVLFSLGSLILNLVSREIGFFTTLFSPFLWCCAVLSLLSNLKEEISFRETWQEGVKILASCVWLIFLGSSVILGGILLWGIFAWVARDIGVLESFLFLDLRDIGIFILYLFLLGVCFYLLLGLGPGTIVRLSFSIIALVFEKVKGMNALLRSKHLVRGRFCQVFLRWLLIGVTLIIFVIACFFLSEINTPAIARIASRFFVYVLLLFILPFILIYTTLVYKDLEQTKEEVCPLPTLRRKIKYGLSAIPGGSMIVLYLGFVLSMLFLNTFLGKDEPPVEDNDLWLSLSKIEVKEEENAFYPIAKIRENIYFPEGKEKLIYGLLDSMQKGEDWDSQFAEELVKNNQEAFGYLEKALQCTIYQDPCLQDLQKTGTEIPRTKFINLRDFSRLISIKAWFVFNQGKEKQAIDEIIKVLRLAQMFKNSPRGNLTTMINGIIIEGIAFTRLKSMFSKTSLPVEELRYYLDKLNAFKLNRQKLANHLRMQYMVSITAEDMFKRAITNKDSKALRELREFEGFRARSGYKPSFGRRLLNKIIAKFLGGNPLTIGLLGDEALLEISLPNYHYKPNQTQRWFADYYRKVINNLDKGYYIEVERVVERVEELYFSYNVYNDVCNYVYSVMRYLFAENIVGKSRLSSLTPLIYYEIFRNEFLLTGTQIILAIKAYEIENGRLPSSLEELVPGYFSQVPQDPLSGKAFRYFPEKRIISSADEKNTMGF